ncbi:MAG: hypothetical protein WC979_02500 [Candidatus Pacearchaeota archaeon]|jgi:hypothetical protein|nr:hypothetical protein [Clostridia bacterium]
MPQVRTFILKSKFPGGYNVGDMVSDRGVGVWYWNTTSAPCMFDPTKEPHFFVEFAMPKYKKGDSVYLRPDKVKVIGNGIGEKTALIVQEVLQSTTPGVPHKYSLKNGTKVICTVIEDNIHIPTFYWFINSSGKVCQDTYVSDDYKTTYRKRTNNFFKTKESANLSLDNVMNPKKR